MVESDQIQRYIDTTSLPQEHSGLLAVTGKAWQECLRRPSNNRFTQVVGELVRVTTKKAHAGQTQKKRDNARLEQVKSRWHIPTSEQKIPLLNIDEVPHFLCNLRLGLASGSQPLTALSPFRTQALARCGGFTRDDVDYVFRAQQTYLHAKNNLDPNPTDSIHATRQQEPLKAISQSYPEQPSLLSRHLPASLKLPSSHSETQVQNEHMSLLEAFRDALWKRETAGGRSHFDKQKVPAMCRMFSQDHKLPWAISQQGNSGEYDYIALNAMEMQEYVSSGASLENTVYVVRDDVRQSITGDMNDLLFNKLLGRGQNGVYVEVNDTSIIEEEVNFCGENPDHGIESLDINSGNSNTEAEPEEAPFNRLMPLADVVARYKKSCEKSPQFTDDCLPVNLLDLWRAGMPRSQILALHARYEGIQNGEARGRGGRVGKLSYHHSSFQACASFELFGIRGAFSGPHLDIYGFTLVSCLSGLKAWFICNIGYECSGQQEEWLKQFREEGSFWSPPSGVFKLILLRPGDTLIMPPGSWIIHAPITVDSCVMSGGMFIDQENLLAHARHILALVRKDITTNEFVSGDFAKAWNKLCPPYEKELLERGQDQVLKDFREVNKALQDALSCQCAHRTGRCPSSCCCLTGYRKACIIWCHIGYSGCRPPKTSKKRKAVPQDGERTSSRRAEKDD